MMMNERPYFVTLEEAQHICNQSPIHPKSEVVHLDESHGRILAQDLKSQVNDPPFDNSSMDGFASRFDPSATYPLTLPIVGIHAATGGNELTMVEPHEAVRIMTGAPMPPGTDAILPIEQCLINEVHNTVTFLEAPKQHFVRRQGENLAKGEVALHRGMRLTPAKVGLCATMGYEIIPVYRRLTVGVVSTGDELIPPGHVLQHGEIYESNSFGLAGLVEWAGHQPLRFPSVSDSMDTLRDTLNQAAAQCDLILTSGGVSMGEFDYVRKLMEEEGDIHFWRVKIRPGSPPLFGFWKETPLFGLPGNPVSSHVAFRMLVAPYLRTSLHADGPKEWMVRAKLCDQVKATQDCLTLRRVNLVSTNEGMMAYQPKHQGSGNLDSLATASGLTLLQPGQTGEVGDWIDVLVL
jgi:molybdopterin molybdotransferase